MPAALAALFFFAILTLWVPAYWPVTVFQLGVFAVAGVTIFRLPKDVSRVPYPVAPLFFAVLWGLAQWLTGHTVYPYATKTAIVQWATFLAVFVAGRILFHNAVAARKFRSAMVWFAFLIALLAILQSATGDGKIFWLFSSDYNDHVMGPILNRNHFAAFIEAVLPIALYRTFRGGNDSLPYAGVSALLYASVVASASRAGTAIVTGEVIVVIALVLLRREFKGHGLVVAGCTLLVFAAIFSAIAGWQQVWQRITAPDPFRARREFALATIQMIKDRPWFGWGLGTWPVVYPSYELVDMGAFANRAHSDWLEWTAEGGLPVGIAMLSLFVWSVFPAYRTIWGIGAVAVFVHAAVDYPFSRPALGSWQILILAAISASSSRQRSIADPVGNTNMPERKSWNERAEGA